MKYRSLPFLFAAVFLAAAAPVRDEYSQEVLLQRALDDTESQDHHHIAKGKHTSNAMSPDDQPAVFPSTTLRDVTAYPIRGKGRTDRPRKQTFLPKEVQDHYNSNHEPQETLDGSKEAEVEAFFSLLQNFANANSGTGNTQDSGTERNSLSVAIKLLHDRLKQLKDKDSSSSENKKEIQGLDSESEERNQDIEEVETAEDSANEEAEIEKFKIFKSLLGKALKVLKHKLRSRSRMPGEDREAVNNPTKWKDLGRNLLGTIGDQLDPSDREEEETVEEQVTEEAEIEKFKAFLGKALKLLQHKLRSRSRMPEEDREAVNRPTKWKDLARNLLGIVGDRLDESDTTRRSGGGTEVEIEGTSFNDGENNQDTEEDEEAAAEIEGFRSILSKALRLVNKKLKPSSRTPDEDREAVNNPMKWTDLGRNLLEVLQDKIDNGGRGSTPQEEIETEGAFSDPNTDGAQEDQIAEEETIGRLAKKLIRLFRQG